MFGECVVFCSAGRFGGRWRRGYIWNMFAPLKVRSLAAALGMLLGLAVVQRGLFHRCEHVQALEREAESKATITGICSVCDTMLPVFGSVAALEVVSSTRITSELVPAPVSQEQRACCALIPGRGPPVKAA